MKFLKLLIGSVIALAIVVSVGVGGWLYLQLQPAHTTETQMQTFVVKQGEGVSSIGQRLFEAGLIKSPIAFRVVVQAQGIGQKIQAGSFKLSPSTPLLELAQALTVGTQDVWITLPEGMRREEMAEHLAAYELEAFDPQLFLELTVGKEGQLFPDTYLVPQLISTERLVSLLESTFETRIAGLDFPEGGELSIQEYIVLASLIQREARTTEDMHRVSGILQNRLAIQMPLQVDATLQYAKGYSVVHQRWWGYPVPEDKELASPFNTYQIAGLPPQPIANPGEAALKAALDPIESDDLFYIHAPDGSMYYAKTLAEHNQNVNRYLR